MDIFFSLGMALGIAALVILPLRYAVRFFNWLWGWALLPKEEKYAGGFEPFYDPPEGRVYLSTPISAYNTTAQRYEISYWALYSALSRKEAEQQLANIPPGLHPKVKHVFTGETPMGTTACWPGIRWMIVVDDERAIVDGLLEGHEILNDAFFETQDEVEAYDLRLRRKYRAEYRGFIHEIRMIPLWAKAQLTPEQYVYKTAVTFCILIPTSPAQVISIEPHSAESPHPAASVGE